MNPPDERASNKEPAGSDANPQKRQNEWVLTPPPSDLIASPLDFFLAEHYQQRIFARMLEQIADGAAGDAAISAALAYMRNDLFAHVLDEEYSLFPALKAVCTEADDIDALIGLLMAEHEEDGAGAAAVSEVLVGLESGATIGPQSRAALRDFASHLRRHLALENGVLLPLARVRIGAAGLEAIADAIRRRRAGQRAAQGGDAQPR